MPRVSYYNDEIVYTFAVSGNVAVANDTSPGRLWVTEPCTVMEAFANVRTAPTGAAITIAISRSGTADDPPVFSTDVVQSTALQIAATEHRGSTTTINDSALLKGHILTLDIDAVGSIVTGADLIVQLRCIRRIR